MQPVAAAKLTGKGFGTEIALLSAVDDRAVSPTGEDHPIYNLLRLQRDLGAQSRLGVVYTDRIVGSNYNRVGGVDARLLFGEVYSRPAPARRQPHADGRRHDHGAALVRPLRPERPHLRIPGPPSTRAIPTSGRRAGSSRVPGCPTPISIRG